MSWVAVAVLGGAAIGAIGAKSAANTAADAANRASDTNLQMFQTTNAQQAPWRQAGENALGTIGAMQPQFTHSFDANDLKTNLAPNYQFMLDQGLGATKNAANLQTGLLSGNTLKGVADYAENYAGNAYQSAFKNYQDQQNNIFNRLSNIAGLGGQVATQGGSQGVTAAGQAGQAQIAGGAASAAGTMGAANAISGGMNNALGWYMLPQVMNYGNSGGGTQYIDNTMG